MSRLRGRVKIPEVSDSDESYKTKEKHPIELNDRVGPCCTVETLTQLNRMEETYVPQWSDMAGSPGGPSPLAQAASFSCTYRRCKHLIRSSDRLMMDNNDGTKSTHYVGSL